MDSIFTVDTINTLCYWTCWPKTILATVATTHFN